MEKTDHPAHTAHPVRPAPSAAAAKALLRLMAAALPAFSPAEARVKVAASIPDLASIAASVGGGAAEVFAIARADANPHAVEVLPSYMIKVSRAQVYLKAGLGLDAWADAVVDGSRSAELRVVDCSRGVRVLGKPEGKADASLGDVHPDGNPHYWLDPDNAGPVADAVRDALKEADPAHAPLFDSLAAAFKAENARRAAAWKARLAPLAGMAVLTYHDSWLYFASAFRLRIVGRVEPFPGIPPSGRHLQSLIGIAKRENARALIQEPYFPDKDARFLERNAGLRVLRFSPSCSGTAAGDYWRHFDDMVGALAPEAR